MGCCVRLGEELTAMLFLAAYVFLLRVPSEGLPMVRGGVGSSATASVNLEGDEVRVVIQAN